jgi:tripartite-type tricarboxylate transporter receptor subunit TctC
MQPLLLLTFLAAHAAAPFAALAQAKFPQRPVRIVTVGAGSQNDIVARMLGPKLTDLWGQPVVVENRTGAGGAMAAAAVAKATPDGYTVLMLSNQFAIGAAVHTNLPYDPIKDFAGVTRIGMSSVAVTVPPSLGVKSVAELIAHAKAAPKPLLFSSSGAGSGTHMNCEMFRVAGNFRATHVAFRSSAEATIEVAAGRAQFSVLPLGPALPFIKEGRVLALAVASHRSPHIPDVPAMSEVLPNYERAGSYGVLAPAGTPRAVLQQLNKAFRTVLDHTDLKERFVTMSFTPGGSTPEEFDKMVRSDIDTFVRMAKLAGLRAK